MIILFLISLIAPSSSLLFLSCIKKRGLKNFQRLRPDNRNLKQSPKESRLVGTKKAKSSRQTRMSVLLKRVLFWVSMLSH